MVVQTSVSVKRLNKFLNAEELDENAVTHDDSFGTTNDIILCILV